MFQNRGKVKSSRGDSAKPSKWGVVKSALKLTDELRSRSKFHQQVDAEIKARGEELYALAQEVISFDASEFEQVSSSENMLTAPE